MASNTGRPPPLSAPTTPTTNPQHTSATSPTPTLTCNAGTPAATGTTAQPSTGTTASLIGTTTPSTTTNAPPNAPSTPANAPSTATIVQPSTRPSAQPPPSRPNAVAGVPRPHVNEWTSIWLRWHTLLFTASITVVLLAGTIALTVLSARGNGFASTKLESHVLTSFLPSISVGIGLVWTVLPALIFQLYALTIAAIVNAASIRQPYIELRNADDTLGAPPEKSILLDYQSYWFLEAPYRALQYNHYMLAYSFSIALLFKTLLAPLSAHLFYTTTAYVLHDIGIQQTSFLNKNGLAARDSLEPILEAVSGTLIYGANPPAWTTLDTSFAPMAVPDAFKTQSDVANFTIPTHAVAARMDCSILGPDMFEMARDQNDGWNFRASDRGCGSGVQSFVSSIGEFSIAFVQTYFLDCSFDAQQSRVLVIGALRANSSSNSGFKNVTAVSCIPTYSHNTGSLTVSFDISKPDYPNINNINNFTHTINTTYEELPEFGGVFEFQLVQQASILDISGTLTATGYGNLIYRYANTLSSDAYMSGDVLLKATSDTFIAGFAVAANQYLFQSGLPQTVRATYLSDDTRVVVVVAIASTMCSLLFLSLILLAWIHFYTWKHRSILYEEPIALASAAATLRQSSLLADVQRVVTDTGTGEVRQALIKDQRTNAPGRGWFYEDWDDPEHAVLKTSSKAKPFGLFRRH